MTNMNPPWYRDPIVLLFFLIVLTAAMWEHRPDALVQDAFIGFNAAFLAMLKQQTSSTIAQLPPTTQQPPAAPVPIRPAVQL